MNQRSHLRELAVAAADRPVLSRALGVGVSGYLAARRRRLAVVQPRDGLWIHRYRGGDYVVDRKPTLVTPEQRAAIARDVYLYRYDLRPGDVVADIGAGIGSEALEFARIVAPSGRVLACEANPETARCTRKLFALTETTNVDVLVAA